MRKSESVEPVMLAQHSSWPLRGSPLELQWNAPGLSVGRSVLELCRLRMFGFLGVVSFVDDAGPVDFNAVSCARDFYIKIARCGREIDAILIL